MKIITKKEIQEIYKKIHPEGLSRTRFPEPKKEVIKLPDDFTGSDLKKAKRLMKGEARLLIKEVTRLQIKNPNNDPESIDTEIEGFKILNTKEKRVYIKELLMLSETYHWKAENMPQGRFFGLIKIID